MRLYSDDFPLFRFFLSFFVTHRRCCIHRTDLALPPLGRRYTASTEYRDVLPPSLIADLGRIGT